MGVLEVEEKIVPWWFLSTSCTQGCCLQQGCFTECDYTWCYLLVCLFAGLLAYPRTLGGTSWSLKTGQTTCIPPSSSLSHPFYTQPTIPVKSYTFIFQFLIHLEPSSHLPIYQVTIDPWFQIYRINWDDPQGCRFGPWIKPPNPGETPIFRSRLVPYVALLCFRTCFFRGQICNLDPPSTSPGPPPQNVHHPVRCAGTEHQSVPPPPRPDGTSGQRRLGHPKFPVDLFRFCFFLVIKKKTSPQKLKPKRPSHLVSDAGGKKHGRYRFFSKMNYICFCGVNSEFFKSPGC